MNPRNSVSMKYRALCNTTWRCIFVLAIDYEVVVSDLLGSNPRAYKRLANLGCDPSVKISEKDFNRLMDMAQASGTLEKLNEIYDRELEHMQGS